MPSQLALDFTNVLLFLVVAIGFVLIALTFGWFLRSRRPSEVKLSSYECGERVFGPAWVQFNVRFYVIALIFLIFEVEVALLFPWAVVYRELLATPDQGVVVLVDMLVFVGILLVGLAYVWKKGDLGWIQPRRGHPSQD